MKLQANEVRVLSLAFIIWTGLDCVSESYSQMPVLIPPWKHKLLRVIFSRAQIRALISYTSVLMSIVDTMFHSEGKKKVTRVTYERGSKCCFCKPTSTSCSRPESWSWKKGIMYLTQKYKARPTLI